MSIEYISFFNGWDVADGEAVMKVENKQRINVNQVILVEK